MSDLEKMAQDIVKKWIWDCGDSLSLSFVQSELLQQRIIEALSTVTSHNRSEDQA